MGAYEDKRDAAGRSIQFVVEIELDACANIYGVDNGSTSFCEATPLSDGQRCHYSFGTCQDPLNFVRTTRKYRFCFNDVEWTDNTLDPPPYPLLRKFIPGKQEVDVSKIYVYPEKITARLAYDYDPPPIDHAKGSGFYNTARQGEFWRNLVARHRNYPGRPMRIFRGFAGIDFSDFVQVGPDYELRLIELKGDGCVLTGESPLAKLNKRRIPYAVSDDNHLLAAVTDSATTWTPQFPREFPDPADAQFVRNKIYAEIEDPANGDEIVEITAITDTTWTVVRGRLGTTPVAHGVNLRLKHVVLFGTDQGAGAPAARNGIEVLRDMMEWAKVDPATVDTTAFDNVKNDLWPDQDVLRIVRKSDTVARMMQPLRHVRGLLLYIDTTGKFSLRPLAPTVTFTKELKKEQIVQARGRTTLVTKEDEVSRITRVYFHYDPIVENPGEKARDYRRHVLVVDAGLEQPNNFGEPKDGHVYDPWTDPGFSAGRLRNVGRRMITRLRTGIRTHEYRLEIKDGEVNVGDPILFECDFLRKPDGVTLENCATIVTGKKEVTRSVNEIQSVDVNNYQERFFLIADDSTTDDYDTATDEEKTKNGFWGDPDENRLGVQQVPGYVVY